MTSPMANAEDLIVRCPRCGERGRWFAVRWGPFCSERCRLIDLGRWFTEENVISRPLQPRDFSGNEDLPPGPGLDRPTGE